jgi:hypothetical protein
LASISSGLLFWAELASMEKDKLDEYKHIHRILISEFWGFANQVSPHHVEDPIMTS